MHPDTDRTLHVHLALFAIANALAVVTWALAGAGGGRWPFWVLVVWAGALAVVVARSDRL